MSSFEARLTIRRLWVKELRHLENIVAETCFLYHRRTRRWADTSNLQRELKGERYTAAEKRGMFPSCRRSEDVKSARPRRGGCSVYGGLALTGKSERNSICARDRETQPTGH